ncbi:MAG: hypothetical protein LBE27_05460 [Deltaproteobacteria bacterium]|nr:hypothetical protein [Deltaproteobacteria bacterium]
MKKSLALVLGIILGIALAAPAFAASPIEFEGYVKVFHENLSNFQRRAENPLDRESFFWNRFEIAATFKPNDNVLVFWQFRGPDFQRWGAGGTELATRAVYGEMSFDFGTVRGGHIVEGLPGTVGGLASLGYAPAWGTEGLLYVMPFDYNSPVDALTFDNKWDLTNGHKFGLAVYYDKIGTNFDNSNLIPGAYPVGITAFTDTEALDPAKDQDYDVFGVEGTYEWDTGGFSLGVEYQRNNTDPAVEKDYAMFVNPAFVQSFGPFAIHFEGKIGWGKRTYNRDLVPENVANWIAVDYLGGEPGSWNYGIENKGLGLYLDGVYTYDQGDLTIAGWYVTGSNMNEKRGSLNSLVDLGDFAPFLVAFNGQTLGNGQFSDVLGAGWMGGTGNSVFEGWTPDGSVDAIGYNVGQKNQWGIGILGNHTIIPDKISMNYGLGYFRLAKPSLVWVGDDNGGYYAAPFVQSGDPSPFRYQSKDLGWEIDLGFTFFIFENVYLETQIGYMFNGDAFEYWDDDAKAWKDPKDTFAWANVLAFQF